MNTIIKLLLLLITIILTNSCRKSTYNVYSPDKKQCITIITKDTFRYIINGCHRNIPDTNFVKIDYHIINREDADEVVGCWRKDGYDWIVMINNAIVLENKLDTTRYKFRDRFPVDVDNCPTLKGYRSVNCFDLMFDRFKLPDSGRQ